MKIPVRVLDIQDLNYATATALGFQARKDGSQVLIYEGHAVPYVADEGSWTPFSIHHIHTAQLLMDKLTSNPRFGVYRAATQYEAWIDSVAYAMAGSTWQEAVAKTIVRFTNASTSVEIPE